MADDHGYIQYPTGRNPRETADRKIELLGKIAQKMECTEQKIGERQSILLEKTLKIGYLCRENGFSTLILEVLYTCNVLIINVSVENADM